MSRLMSLHVSVCASRLQRLFVSLCVISLALTSFIPISTSSAYSRAASSASVVTHLMATAPSDLSQPDADVAARVNDDYGKLPLERFPIVCREYFV